MRSASTAMLLLFARRMLELHGCGGGFVANSSGGMHHGSGRCPGIRVRAALVPSMM
uniref:Uncharacterized protein n=1 Tax=Setaria viridis TaxID=4556 RepID=A0A4U6W9T1_SETVI|nr:hypothetical protein SEVIR_1G136101v2 [Setaria viridis]